MKVLELYDDNEREYVRWLFLRPNEAKNDDEKYRYTLDFLQYNCCALEFLRDRYKAHNSNEIVTVDVGGNDTLTFTVEKKIKELDEDIQDVKLAIARTEAVLEYILEQRS